jgi:hypothetical protein
MKGLVFTEFLDMVEQTFSANPLEFHITRMAA